MKKIITKALMVMSLALIAIPTFANSELVAKDGGEKIVTQRALRTVESVGGGTWDYGVINDMLHSGYYHGSLYHSSTATSSYDSEKDYADAGDNSYAEVKSSGWNGTNKVNWNTY